MEVWADIAQVFCWPPSELERLDWPDLMRWRRQAVERMQARIEWQAALAGARLT